MRKLLGSRTVVKHSSSGINVARSLEAIAREDEAETSVDLRDHYVQFRLGDIYLPDPLTVIYELHGNELLRGKVIEMSDGGDREDAYVIVVVEDIPHRMVVPVDRVVIQD
jgi:hypothetical protein